jgi:hypothetical protein
MSGNALSFIGKLDRRDEQMILSQAQSACCRKTRRKEKPNARTEVVRTEAGEKRVRPSHTRCGRVVQGDVEKLVVL